MIWLLPGRGAFDRPNPPDTIPPLGGDPARPAEFYPESMTKQVMEDFEIKTIMGDDGTERMKLYWGEKSPLAGNMVKGQHTSGGYIGSIWWQGRAWREHQIVWWVTTGWLAKYDPKSKNNIVIDHGDRVRDNNDPRNLQYLFTPENLANLGKTMESTPGDGDSRQLREQAVSLLVEKGSAAAEEMASIISQTYSRNMKERYKDPDYADKMKEAQRRTETREKKSAACSGWKHTQEAKDKISAASQRNREDPAHVAKHGDACIAAAAKQGAGDKRSELSVALWQDPDYRERTTAGIKKVAADPEYRKRKSEKGIEVANRPGESERRSERMTKKWQDPEFRAKQKEARTGRVVTEETRAKIKDSLGGRRTVEPAELKKGHKRRRRRQLAAYCCNGDEEGINRMEENARRRRPHSHGTGGAFWRGIQAAKGRGL